MDAPRVGDLTGHTYGRLTVLHLEGPARWVCRCECGNLKSVAQGNLRRGQVKSCGCLHLNEVTNDLVGQRFDRLVVLAREGSAKGGVPLWRCLCDCGNEVVVRGIHLRSGNTKSCGCRTRGRPGAGHDWRPDAVVASGGAASH